jgi:hypothetical protein
MVMLNRTRAESREKTDDSRVTSLPCDEVTKRSQACKYAEVLAVLATFQLSRCMWFGKS